MTAIYRAVLLSLICIFGLTGCAGSFRFVVRDYCELHKPGKPHRKDTQGTKNWFDNDRTFYSRRCP